MGSEKKKIERATAEIFLALYNDRQSTSYEIHSLSEAPDVICVDPTNNTQLNLEISLLEDIQGETRYSLGRRNKPVSPTTGTTAVSLFEDVQPHWEQQIENKLLASYGERTALVLRQVSILWEPREWEIVAPQFRDSVLKGKESNYGAGVWVICTDNDTWPATNTLFCLSPPTD